MTDEQTRERTVDEQLRERFPDWMFEDKRGMAYLSQEFVRERLIESTGNQFDFSIQSIEYRNDGALKDRTNQNTGEVTPAPPVCVVIGTMSIPGLGVRSEIGVQEMEAGSGADASYKGAVSDCLKRCALAFGVGLQQLYVETNKKFIEHNRPSRQQNAPQPRQTNGTPPTAVPAAISTGDLTDAQFMAAYVDARNRRSGAELKALMDRPDTTSDRWVQMVHSTQSVAQVEYVIGEMTDRQVASNPKFERAVAERRKNLVGIEVPA